MSRRFPPFLVIAILLATLNACGPSKGRTTDATVTTVTTDAAQTYEIVSATEVAAGLASTKPLLETAASLAGVDGPKGQRAVTAVYDAWYAFEGTIRKTDQAIYLDMEDALVAVKAGVQQKDAAKASKGSADFTRLANRYLAKFPATVNATPDTTEGTAAAALVPTPAARSSVAIQLADYAVIAPTKLRVGQTTFEIANVGRETHEFIVLRTDLEPNAFTLNAEKRFVEDAPGVVVVDEKEGIKAGSNATLLVNLPAGNYVFACNLLGHFGKGMAIKVRVG